VKVVADTNVLVRAAVGDHTDQAKAAARVLRQAELIAVPTVALCELVWVLRSTYGLSRANAGQIVRNLAAAANVRVDSPAVQAGLAALDRGGDFADGVIAFEGGRLGGIEFATFDRKAARLLEQTMPTRLL
jgi:predicted nucleic-acid-binding protein